MSWVIALAVSACALFLVSNAEAKIRKLEKRVSELEKQLWDPILRNKANQVAIGYTFSRVHGSTRLGFFSENCDL
ncbi:hypothetical protein BLX87_23695 [Bacillus sp. VT-16-64]|nr:hypothetical protein BLX87_23695 [Bacillus sp. VT-16-64]